MSDIVRLRREIHRHPERSGREQKTAGRIESHLARLRPHSLMTGLGGFGLAAIFDSGSPGPTVLLRAELDAVPVQETAGRSYGSVVGNTSHSCGHDGHMAILSALAEQLSLKRPARGRAVLLFQPAEENGSGAAAVLADPRFKTLSPDYAFALHNLPGFSEGEVVIRSGPFSCASTGLVVRLRGKAAHAAQPDTGRSPALPMCRIIEGLPRLGRGADGSANFSMATVVYARLGVTGAFGTAPESAEVMATLRSDTNQGLADLVKRGIDLAGSAASAGAVGLEVDRRDEFPATVNTEEGAVLVISAANRCGFGIHHLKKPFPWSEDFGHFTGRFGGALFGLGAGRAHPELHHPDYDFPETLIPKGCALFEAILEQLLNEPDP
ncbi:MAG: amidohydrolase [Desulfobacterales bacterium]